MTDQNPYVGPRPFEREDSGRFFGRDQEANELLSLIIANRVVVLYAQSGAGKTSLINALLLSLLEAEGFEVLSPARVYGPTPEGITLDQIPNIYIFNTFLTWDSDQPDVQALAQLSKQAYLERLPRVEDEYGLPRPRVLIIDQFEELFTTYPQRWRDRDDFFHQISQALQVDPTLRVVFSMREDYIAQMDPYAFLLPGHLRARIRLERMRPEAALLAVRGPLRATNREFAAGVAEELVEDLRKIRVELLAGDITSVVGEFIEPVQLQVVCQNLWRDLPTDVSMITSVHLQAYGDVNQALSQFYERVVQRAVQETDVREGQLREWFISQLITPAGTRGTVYRGTAETGSIANEAVQVMENAHLIRGEYRSGSRWYELTHDTLIEPIQQSNRIWEEKRREARFRKIRNIGIGTAVTVIGLLLIYILATAVFTQMNETAGMADAASREAELALVAQSTAEARVAATSTYIVAQQAATTMAIGVESLRLESSLGTQVAIDRATAAANPEATPDSVATLTASQIALTDARAQVLVNSFLAAATDQERIQMIIGLFDLAITPDDPYNQMARDLFYSRYPNSDFLSLLSETVLSASSTTQNELNLEMSSWQEGRRLAESGQLEQAIEAYNSAISVNNQNLVLYFDRGSAYFELGNYQPALSNFEQALSAASLSQPGIRSDNGVFGGGFIYGSEPVEMMGQKICQHDELRGELVNHTEMYPLLNEEFPLANGLFEAWPTQYRNIIQQFGANPQNYQQFGLPGHEGLDIMAPTGSKIFAVAPGRVTVARTEPQGHPYGILVRIEHMDGYETTYGQMQELYVSVGELVQACHIIGLADNTGNSFGAHLHLTLKKEGVTYQDYPNNITDPTPFLLPLLGWAEPTGPYVEGWAHTAGLFFIDNLAQVGSGGINLKQAPDLESQNVSLIPEGAIVIVTGGARGDYVPVKVAVADLENGLNGPLVIGRTLLGLHASTDPGPFAEADFAEFMAARPSLIKVLSYHDRDAIARLAQDHPEAQWMIRTWLDLNGRNLSPAQYLQDTIADVRKILEVLEGKEVVIELHSEPNLVENGLGSSWTDGAAFAIWWLELLNLYRQVLPEAHFIYPGLSPGSNVGGLRQDHEEFIEASRIAVEAADGLGIHIFWSNVYPMDTALGVLDDFVVRFPTKAIWVTEASNYGDLSAAQRAAQYLQFWGELRERPTVRGVVFFVVSSSHPDFANEVWVGNGIGQRVGSR